MSYRARLREAFYQNLKRTHYEKELKEIGKLVNDGHPVKLISNITGLSEATIRNYILILDSKKEELK